jgi:toxin-antitoxin system PIN domain toxin
MSFSIDTNVLVFAYNQDTPQHKAAQEFLQAKIGEEETWVMPWPVVHSFLRLTTHPGIMPRPLSAREASAVIQAFVELPQLQLIGESPDFWEPYKKDLLQVSARGNLVPDVQIIALLKQNGVKTFFTADRDFRRFDGIKIVDPLR